MASTDAGPPGGGNNYATVSLAEHTDQQVGDLQEMVIYGQDNEDAQSVETFKSEVTRESIIRDSFAAVGRMSFIAAENASRMSEAVVEVMHHAGDAARDSVRSISHMVGPLEKSYFAVSLHK
jgi:hypothetical protein